MGGGNGHAVAGLMARTARTAIGTQVLEKWSREVNASAIGAVRLRSATGIREQDSVGNEGDLPRLNLGDDH